MKNKSVVLIPFKDSALLNNDLFKECVTSVTYDTSDRQTRTINLDKNFEMTLEKSLKLNVASYIPISGGNRESRETVLVLTSSFLSECTLQEAKGESIESIIGGICATVLVLFIILSVFFLIRRKWKKEEAEIIHEDRNPDYNYDYGQATVKDVNEYYDTEE